MNEFIAKFNSFPLGQKLLLVGLLGILMVVGFYFLQYQPHQAQVESAQKEINRLKMKKVETETLQSKRAEILVRLEKLNRRLLIAREELPVSAEVPSLLQKIHNQAKTAGLEINKFKREDNVAQQYYTEIPVEMQLEGTYDELANFFFYIGRLKRIVNVRDISLQTDVRSEGVLKVEALATTFMYNSSDGAAPTKGKKGKRKKK